MVKKSKRFMPQDLRGHLVDQMVKLRSGRATATDSNAVSNVADQIHKSVRFSNKSTVLSR